MGQTAAGRRWVYPRVCGGTHFPQGDGIVLSGLSPRVRGNPSYSPGDRSCRGSIPACAGEPYTCSSRPVKRKVYPRVCGGTCYPILLPLRVRGLSPRVRGNHPICSRRQPHGGSIPACAGEPLYPTPSVGKAKVYPRVCGGTAGLVARSWPACGLSPRVRGNPRQRRRAGNSIRSIPACAGEPLSPSSPGRPDWVYPRVCGGTLRDQRQARDL